MGARGWERWAVRWASSECQTGLGDVQGPVSYEQEVGQKEQEGHQPGLMLPVNQRQDPGLRSQSFGSEWYVWQGPGM